MSLTQLRIDSRPNLAAADFSAKRSSFRGRLVAVAIGAAIFWLAYDNGSFGVQSRSATAIVMWWLVLLAVVLGFWPAQRLGGPAAAAGLLLAGYAAWTAASMAWAPSVENAFLETNRVALYLGGFLFVLIAGRRSNVGRWCDGLAVGITATALLSLLTRFFPNLIETGLESHFLPAGLTRLNYPVGYWNGLAVLTAFAVPLLLRAALLSPSSTLRGVAVAPIPAFAAVIYLASSRTGVIVAILGTFSLLVASPRRVALAGALTFVAVGSATAIWVLARRDLLVNGPLGTAAAEHEGWTAAVAIGTCCLIVGTLYGAASGALHGKRAPGVATERAVLTAATILLAAAIVAVHPVRRLHEFTQLPASNISLKSPNYVQNHLFSGSGNGRWQYWIVAADEGKDHLLHGGGAGSYQQRWERDRPIFTFVQDAHSLYAEAFGELGSVGLVLILGVVIAGLGAAVLRLRGDHEQRLTVAALGSCFLAFAVAAGVDWMWELTVVALCGMIVLALLVGPATDVGPPSRRLGFAPLAAGVAAAALALPVMASQGVALLSDLRLEGSRAAAQRNDFRGALNKALDVRSIESWAATPYLQVALLQEQVGDLDSARRSIGQAIKRDRSSWSLWLVQARLETKAGAVGAARRSLSEARRLNPFALPRAG